MMGTPLPADLFRDRTMCRTCNKWGYVSRKIARKVIRAVHIAEPGINVYRCPADPELWHVGHLRAHHNLLNRR